MRVNLEDASRVQARDVQGSVMPGGWEVATQPRGTSWEAFPLFNFGGKLENDWRSFFP